MKAETIRQFAEELRQEIANGAIESRGGMAIINFNVLPKDEEERLNEECGVITRGCLFQFGTVTTLTFELKAMTDDEKNANKAAYNKLYNEELLQLAIEEERKNNYVEQLALNLGISYEEAAKFVNEKRKEQENENNND